MCVCEMAALKGRVGGQESPVTSRSQKWVAASEYRVWCSEASVFVSQQRVSERFCLGSLCALLRGDAASLVFSLGCGVSQGGVF